jgi:hypothetical protein
LQTTFSYIILKRFSSVAMVILECCIRVSFMLMLHKLNWDVTVSQCSCFKISLYDSTSGVAV